MRARAYLEQVRRQCRQMECYALEESRDRIILFNRQGEGKVRSHRRWGLGGIREAQDKNSGGAPEYMETIPLFDQIEKHDWMVEMQQVRGINAQRGSTDSTRTI